MQYRAFISYSHSDEQFAGWLQRHIESYRLPREVAESLGYSDLKPVFRDRSDLRSGANLSDSLQQALAESESLVVVCSADAAASRWVNEEIETFRALHGDERIFAIISRDPPPDCFPPALLHDHLDHDIEPIAADARRGFDGRRDAGIKTIAALLDVDFDLLKRRDLRRQVQRRTVAMAVTTAVAATTLLLSLVAIDARDDADRRRAQAEALIGFMLGDLRQRLEPIGRLDVLDAVGDQAMEYFAELEEDEFTVASRLSSAQALRQIGEVRMYQGDLNRALAAFTASHEQTAGLLGISDDPAAIEFELGQSHFWIGYVHYDRGEVAQAREHFESYLELSESLLARKPQDPVYRTELAYSLSNLGTLELAEHRLDHAEQYFRRAADVHQSVLSENPSEPDLQNHLAAAWSWLGAVASESGDILAAIDWYTREHDLRQEIVRVTNDWIQVTHAANSASLLGHQQLMAHQLSETTGTLAELESLSERLVDHDPANADWKRIRGITHILHNRLAIAQSRIQDARVHAEQALAILGPLYAAAPDNVSRLNDLVEALAQQGRTHLVGGEREAAREPISQAVRLLEGRVIDDQHLLVSAASVYLLEGDLRSEYADAAWLRAQDLLAQLPSNRREIQLMLIRIALLERTGNTAAAKRLWQQVDAAGYGGEKNGMLTQALATTNDTAIN